MKPYGSDSSRVIVADGVLTIEMINEAADKAISSGLQPERYVFTSPRLINDLIEWQKREKCWKSLGPVGYRMEVLRWRLKHRVKDNKVLQLPD
jgi:hypothetical protein